MNTVHNIISVLTLILLSWLLADLVSSKLRQRNGIVEYRQVPPTA